MLGIQCDPILIHSSNFAVNPLMFLDREETVSKKSGAGGGGGGTSRPRGKSRQHGRSRRKPARKTPKAQLQQLFESIVEQIKSCAEEPEDPQV